MSSETKVSYDLKRFAGIKRDYTPEEVDRLRGSIKIEYSMCKHQSEKLWRLLNTENYINTLGSLSGNHAVQHAKAGLKAIYLSGWQVAADANSAREMYPDQSLYPFDSAPKLVEAMNNALIRADQIQHMEIKDGDMKTKDKVDYMLPIIADGEAGFGGPLNVFDPTTRVVIPTVGSYSAKLAEYQLIGEAPTSNLNLVVLSTVIDCHLLCIGSVGLG